MDAARFQEPQRRMIPIRSPAGDGEMAVLDFGDSGRPVDVVFLHANGFNALTYRSILAPLSAGLRLVAPDLRGHGATQLAADPRNRRSWNDLRDDVLALLDALGGPPVALAGHSMGATLALLAAGQSPTRMSNLVLFDPVILTPLASRLARLPGARSLALARMPLARAARRRRAVFDSRPAAFQAYRGRGVFAGWPATALADYVAGGLTERLDGKVELACAPAWEASNYAAQGHDTWGALSRFDRPVRLIRAEHGSVSALGDLDRFKLRCPNVVVETAPGGHFFPVERPDLMRDALLDAAF
jgi:pimeloyl-ACP methyl ester carboxylesterase